MSNSEEAIEKGAWKATLAKTAKKQTILFTRPEKARFVKFTALSVHVVPGRTSPSSTWSSEWEGLSCGTS